MNLGRLNRAREAESKAAIKHSLDIWHATKNLTKKDLIFITTNITQNKCITLVWHTYSFFISASFNKYHIPFTWLTMADCIEQWLTDRRQRVVVDGEVSNCKSVLSGVPQGSVLGPLLFLIYINDLDDSITSNVLKFADDTKVFRKANTDDDKQHLQNDLEISEMV